MRTIRSGIRFLSALLLGFLLSANAWAVIPENGWWWNSTESGRGFNLEIQNNLLFFSTFGYDNSGHPAWYVAGGPMTSDRDWSATLYATANGQCFGCPYVAPQTIPLGTVTLHFTSSQTAVLSIAGVSINVKREDWWLNESTPDAMLGEWSAVIGSFGDVFDGERIDYIGKTTSNGTVYASGGRMGSTVALNPALVSYSAANSQWVALLDSSTPFYRLFAFNTTGFNRVEGTFYIYPKGGSPSGSGMFYQAFRTASFAYLQTGTGPASSKSLELTSQAMEARDANLYRQMMASEKSQPVNPAILEMARELEAALREYQGNAR